MIRKAIIFSTFFLILGFLSGMTADETIINNWYSFLVKPSITPPNWIFGPVWAFLYILMGVSVAIIYESDNEYRNTALVFFGFNFFFNILWCIIFFGMQSIDIAFINIIIVNITLIICMYYTHKINKTAFYLFIPYLLWLILATYLNIYIGIYN